MSFPRRNPAWSWKNVDAIDLTLSSPEPEEPPQRQPQGDSRLQLKSEVKAESSKTEAFRRNLHQPESSNSARARNGQPVRPINPDHLARIINTSDSASIRRVLLELCTMSPALSGAVARGLAPNSAFAQETIKAHRTKSNGTNIKTESDINRTSSARAGASNRLAGSRATDDIKRESAPSPPHRHHALHDIKPKVKPDSTFLRMSRSATSSRQDLRDSLSRRPASTSLFKPTSSSRENPAEQELETNICFQCGETVKNRHGNCIHHPGRKKIVNRLGMVVAIYTCCDNVIGEPGCTFGSHVMKSERALGPMKIPYSPHKPRFA